MADQGGYIAVDHPGVARKSKCGCAVNSSEVLKSILQVILISGQPYPHSTNLALPAYHVADTLITAQTSKFAVIARSRRSKKELCVIRKKLTVATDVVAHHTVVGILGV